MTHDNHDTELGDGKKDTLRTEKIKIIFQIDDRESHTEVLDTIVVVNNSYV